MTSGSGLGRDFHTESIFAGRRILVFSVNGAFTPMCTMNPLTGFEAYFDQPNNTELMIFIVPRK